MLWGMAAPYDDFPCAVADADALAFLDPAIGVRQAIDAFAETAEARAIKFKLLFRKSRRAVEPQAFFRRFLPCVGAEIAAHQIIGARHPEFDIEAAHQPAGEPDMIGVKMRNDHPLDRSSAHRA